MKYTDDGNRALAVILVNWNTHDDVASCGQALESRVHVVVVDNASDDQERTRALARLHPHWTVVLRTENGGYAAGMNDGMRSALSRGFTHALLLNPDTYPTESLVDALWLRRDKGSVIGCRQLEVRPDGEEAEYTTWACLRNAKPIWPESKRLLPEKSVDIVSGAAMLVDLRDAASVGYMDERYFHYKEEFDFCFRLRRAGFNIHHTSAASLRHRRGGSLAISSPTAHYYDLRNELLFLRWNFPLYELLRMPGLLKRALLGLVARPAGLRRATRAAIFDASLARTGRTGRSLG